MKDTWGLCPYWNINQSIHFYISQQVIILLSGNWFASLTLCYCFIHKLFNYTSRVKLVEQHTRHKKMNAEMSWQEKWLSIQSRSKGKLRQAACTDLWDWICVICSWEQKLPSQFNSDLNASQDSNMNIIHKRSGVQLDTISKPIKASFRIIVMYLLLWDIAVSVTTLKWRLQVPLA